MGQTARFQETLRRLAMIDAGFVQDQAGLGLDPAAAIGPDPGMAVMTARRRLDGGRLAADAAAALEER